MVKGFESIFQENLMAPCQFSGGYFDNDMKVHYSIIPGSYQTGLYYKNPEIVSTQKRAELGSSYLDSIKQRSFSKPKARLVNKLREHKSQTPYSIQKNDEDEVEFHGFDEDLAETGNTSKATTRRTKLNRRIDSE